MFGDVNVDTEKKNPGDLVDVIEKGFSVLMFRVGVIFLTFLTCRGAVWVSHRFKLAAAGWGQRYVMEEGNKSEFMRNLGWERLVA